MIVVVGNPAWRPGAVPGPGGSAARIAVAAAAAGAAVELVGRAGDDPAGDALLFALTRAGVGHAAVLRDPARPTVLVGNAPEAEPDGDAGPVPTTSDGVYGERGGRAAAEAEALAANGPILEPADVALGLRYLTEYRVVVVAGDVPARVLPVVTESAAYAAAALVVLVPDASTVPPFLPDTAIVLAAPPADDDGAFARVVGGLAAALDRGEEPSAAFRAALAGSGWEATD